MIKKKSAKDHQKKMRGTHWRSRKENKHLHLSNLGLPDQEVNRPKTKKKTENSREGGGGQKRRPTGAGGGNINTSHHSGPPGHLDPGDQAGTTQEAERTGTVRYKDINFRKKNQGGPFPKEAQRGYGPASGFLLEPRGKTKRSGGGGPRPRLSTKVAECFNYGHETL